MANTFIQTLLKVGDVLLDIQQHLLIIVEALLVNVFGDGRRVEITFDILRRRIANLKVHGSENRTIVGVDEIVLDVYPPVSH